MCHGRGPRLCTVYQGPHPGAGPHPVVDALSRGRLQLSRQLGQAGPHGRRFMCRLAGGGDVLPLYTVTKDGTGDRGSQSSRHGTITSISDPTSIRRFSPMVLADVHATLAAVRWPCRGSRAGADVRLQPWSARKGRSMQAEQTAIVGKPCVASRAGGHVGRPGDGRGAIAGRIRRDHRHRPQIRREPAGDADRRSPR